MSFIQRQQPQQLQCTRLLGIWQSMAGLEG